MTDFLPDEDVAAFAGEVRAFLADNLTDEMRRRMHDTGTVHVPQLHPTWRRAGGWRRRPSRTKGAAVSHSMAALFRELELADAPYHGLSITMIVIGVIEQLGSEELKSRVLPRLLAGETIAVLGYSEPGSGSDVAAARTRAVAVDEEHTAWRINGQKMWTTLAQEAGYVLLLTRTDTERPKHLGLTMFVVPLDTPGITIQPIYTMADERTNVVFYDDVEVPDYCRVGEVNEGWRVMGAALSVERGVMGGTAFLEPLLKHASAWARTPGPRRHPSGRRSGRAGGDRPGAHRRRGLLPADPAHRRSRGVRPVAGDRRQHRQTLCEPGLSARRGRAAGGGRRRRHAAPRRGRRRWPPMAGGELERAVRHSAVTTIQGGTSEIQRNHIAQHYLGLPKTRQS